MPVIENGQCLNLKGIDTSNSSVDVNVTFRDGANLPGHAAGEAYYRAL